jgi:L-iditol 2-dehydrogenase
MMRMKIAHLIAVGSFRVGTAPIPTPVPGRVLVAVKSVGICASDIHYFESGKIGDQVCRFPQLLGHECSGVVSFAPSGSGFAEGDRVAVEPSLGCGRCAQCTSGNAHLCSTVRFLGMPGMPGAFQEFIELDEKQLFRLPPMLSFDEGAILEPAGVACHAVNISRIAPGQSIAVFGAGAVGLLTLAIAKIKGAGETFIFDKVSSRLSVAKSLYGVDHAVDVNAQDPRAYILNATQGRGVDIAFEAAGQQQTFSWSFSAPRSGGKTVLIVIPSEDLMYFNAHEVRRKELQVLNVRRSNGELEECIEMAVSGTLTLKGLATHHFPLEHITDAFNLAASRGDGVIRAMIRYP